MKSHLTIIGADVYIYKYLQICVHVYIYRDIYTHTYYYIHIYIFCFVCWEHLKSRKPFKERIPSNYGIYFLKPIRNKRVQEFLSKWLILGLEKEIHKMSMRLENKEILKTKIIVMDVYKECLMAKHGMM